ncbi:MAG: protein-glutamate O-methyltransferase CheR [Gammaproteobacteria bacterium]|nr:protein-glutamate O-methyltransferase CheR [Gammaproteobacteria bacterium]
MRAASQNVSVRPHLAAMSSLPELSDEQFAQWGALINRRTGMHIPVERKSFLTTNIRIRMREAGFSDFEDYYAFVLSGPRGMIEWVMLLDHLTVQETCFNRHTASYDAVREFCRQSACSITSGEKISLQVLSMGCATGEEAYSLAIMIDDELSQSDKDYYFGITATDISSAALAVARNAVYEKRRLEKLDTNLKNKYLTQLDDGVFQVNDFLRDRICFSRLNIMELDSAPLEGMDIIMCQNLLIYFEQNQRQELLNNLVVKLKPEGMLVLGVGEVTGWSHPEMERIKLQDTLIYRRKSKSYEGAQK